MNGLQGVAEASWAEKASWGTLGVAPLSTVLAFPSHPERVQGWQV